MSRLIEIRNETLGKLREGVGRYWKEVENQIQINYNEIPTWILLYEDSDIEESHAEFSRVVSPYFSEMGDVNFTVTYTIFKDGMDVQIDFLNDNNKIARGYGNAKTLGALPQQDPITEPIVFRSRDSKRP